MERLMRSLLWLGVEDYTGLWEAAAEAANSGVPVSTSTARRAGREALSALAAHGWITLHRSPWPVVPDRVEDVPRDRYEQELAVAEHWDPPTPGRTLVLFSTTDSGRVAYDNGSPS